MILRVEREEEQSSLRLLTAPFDLFSRYSRIYQE